MSALARALVETVAPQGNGDRAALTAHATMLEHGFQPVASGQGAPVLTMGADGSCSLQVLPQGWNASKDSYSFEYIHPLRGVEEKFSLKALAIGTSVALHAASSLPGGDLLTVTLEVGAPSTSSPSTEGQSAATPSAPPLTDQLQGWQDKISSGIALKLLGRHNSTSRLGKALAGEAAGTAGSSADASAAASRGKRPAPSPENNRREDDIDMEPDRPGRAPWPDPGREGILPPDRDPFGLPRGLFPTPSPHPFIWTPNGGLLGPRHPAWGQTVPGPLGGRGEGGGMMPRFDPFGPPGTGFGDPEPDHLRVPGRGGGPMFPPGRGGGGFNPDPMFM
eukprot:TRINITY_DN18772_c0_g1_i1.p1 TRINITY_DN18772_c0_g1~~TRINITY_DN18772_c0_g1_i1.p1  ORF type:complete len:335 (-),score=49.31 TRINITY_DN18772_c0_g1_i1:322-1326(-)